MKIILVDKEDNIIGTKERNDIQTDDFYRVAALWITNPQGEILLAQRAFTKSNDPGKWGCACAGTVEEGETYDDNIVKEVFEELGLRLQPKIWVKKPLLTGEHKFFCQWYTATIEKNTPIHVQTDEVAQVRWFAPDELRMFYEENKQLFSKNAAEWLQLFLGTQH